MNPEPNAELLSARRIVDGLSELEMIRDIIWFPNISRWGLCLEVRIDQDYAKELPERTQWWIVLTASYPWGQIDVFPDSEHGTDKTFYHQNRNEPLCDKNVPWRSGKVCYWEPHHINARSAYVSEPIGHNDRLKWVLIRLIEWVNRAATGTLVYPGDPFELPDFSAVEPTIAFAESNVTFKLWKDISQDYGVAEICTLHPKSPIIVREFQNTKGKPLLSLKWGTEIESAQSLPKAVWIWLSNLPILSPYRAPVTWGEFRVAVKNNIHQSLDQILEKALYCVRDGEQHVALIGFPIQNEYGDENQLYRMHWQPLILPSLSSGENFHKGFRPNAKGYWMKDRHKHYNDNEVIQWLKSINWHQDQLSGRGRFSRNIVDSRIAIIGAGAIGSVVAELLVRGGVQNLLIIDKDSVEAGNLARHTLGIVDIGNQKAESLTKHLNQLSPHASVRGIVGLFPDDFNNENMAHLQHCQIVIDCSATDGVLRGMSQWDWNTDTILISISMGFEAERLYLIAGHKNVNYMDALDLAFEAELEMDKGLLETVRLPAEAIGCWHPLFPARIDRIWSLVGIAMDRIEKMITTDGIALTAMLLKWDKEGIKVEQRDLSNV